MLTALTALYAVAAPIAAQDFVTERAAVRVTTYTDFARTFGEEQGTMDGSADRLDLHQGWLELGSSEAPRIR